MAHTGLNRNQANNSNLEISGIAKSGLDLSHNTKDSIRIGRRELLTYEYVMSGDKVKLNTSHNLQFNPTAGSLVPQMDIRTEQVFIPFRSVNDDYKDTLSFDKYGIALNSANYPKTSLSAMLTYFSSNIGGADQDIEDIVAYDSETLRTDVINPAISSISTPLHLYYLNDYKVELQKHLERIVSGWDNMTSEARTSAIREVYYDLLKDFIGEGSYLDKLNCQILSSEIMNSWETGKFANFLTSLTSYYDAPIDLMVLRSMYADWFETTRDSNLEPARGVLPRYGKLGNNVENISQIIFCYLAPRYAIFDKDVFTTANIDSPYRTQVAPIMKDYASSLVCIDSPATGRDSANYTQMQHGALVPNNTGLYDNLYTNADLTTEQSLGLDLVALRRAKLNKQWLQRGMVYGDEYQDHILAQYGVRISDSRINIPEILNCESQELNINTTINPTETSEMPAGTKTCFMDSSFNGNSREFFVEENGIILTWCYIVPSVTYMPWESRHLIMNGKQFPQPIFGNDAEELSYVPEIDRSLYHAGKSTPFGRHNVYHAWRSRVSENHGDFLTSYKPFTFVREFSTDNMPTLNYAYIHAHVNLNFMYDTDPFHTFAFGTFMHKFFVERELPQVTEIC